MMLSWVYTLAALLWTTTQRRRLREGKGTGLASGVEEGTIKKGSHQWSCRLWSILFYSFLFLLNLYHMLIATDSLYCTVSKSDQWETKFLCRPDFHETLIAWSENQFVGRTPEIHFRFWHLWQRRNELSSPPSQLVFKLPIKKQGGAVKLYRAFKGWGTDRFFL